MKTLASSKQLAVDVAVALDVAGREYLVVVAKASWSIPEPGQRPRPLPPAPPEQADVYLGEPGESPMLYGADFARFKPRCDVLFDACAHSPTGEPVTGLTVGWRIGPLQKGLNVVGPRVWQKRLGMTLLSDPEPFLSLPLHYGLAFGGTRNYEAGRGEQRQTLTEALLENPCGIGWAGPHTDDAIDGQPAPCLEALDDPISRPTGEHKPVAFSAIGRHWTPRRELSGTYDDAWRKKRFPFLPDDFDEQFHQCAPPDQQMAYPRGGEEVVLRNMMAGRPHVRFNLPRLDQAKVQVLRTDYSVEAVDPVVDTLYFEPDQGRFTAVWRASVPIRRRIQEFDTVAVGPVDPIWWHEKVTGACTDCDDA